MSDIVELPPLPPLPKLTARLTVSDECDLYDWLQKHRECAVKAATKNLHVALADTAEIVSRYAGRVEQLRALLETANAYGSGENAARLKAEAEVERMRAECERLESLNDIDLASRDEEILRMRVELAQYRYALEIIAGRRQPVDNTLGNVEVARYALDAARKGEA
jgi:hypothetical protein